jgi:hypothetical protein
VAVRHTWFGLPDLGQLEARIARRRLDAYHRVLDADGLPRGLQDRALRLLLCGDVLTPRAIAQLQWLRGAVARTRTAHASDDPCARSLLSVHAGLSLLLLDCDGYRRRLEEETRRPGLEPRDAALALAAD